MNAFADFPEEKQRAWLKIERLLDKELATETEAMRDDVKLIMASTLKDHDELFTEDLPYLLALLKNGQLDNLQKHTDAETAKKVVELVEILAPKIKLIMCGAVQGA